MKEPVFFGTATALYTPITDGKINYGEFSETVESQIKAGIDALVFLGTTGESATVSEPERKEITGFAVETVKKRVPVIIGCGSNCTEKTVSLCKEAKRAGADCALLVTPYYNKCNQRGLFRHYEYVSDNADFPFIFYDVPKRTGVRILPETAGKIFSLKNAIGFKEADDDKENYLKILSLYSENYAVYCGSDGETFDFYENGAAGTVSVASNVIPEEMVSLFRRRGKCSDGQKQRLSEFFRILSADVNPIPLKAVLSAIGKKGVELRLPLTEISPEKAEYVRRSLHKLNIC